MNSASSEFGRFHALAIEPTLNLSPAPGVLVTGLSGGAHRFGPGTHFGLLTTGRLFVESEDFSASLSGPSFFVVGPGTRVEGEGRVFVIGLPGYRGLTQLGPRIEARGRLRYIDGCTDTLLVCPPRVGEPCLNHLHIPPGTRQSAHHHPSLRLGVIARGRGRCVTPGREYLLEPGMGWCIPAGLVHAFFTQDEALDVLAWHPDSDFGPRDEDHPMINRTLLGDPG